MALLSHHGQPHPGTGSVFSRERQRQRLPPSTQPWTSTSSLEVGTWRLPHLCRRRRGRGVRRVCAQPGILDPIGDRRLLGSPTLRIPHRLSPRLHLFLGHNERRLPPGQSVQSAWDCETLLHWLYHPLFVRALLHGLHWWLTFCAFWGLPRPVSLAQWPGKPHDRCLLPTHSRRLIQPSLLCGLCLPLPPHYPHPRLERMESVHRCPASHYNCTLCPRAQTRPCAPRISQAAWPPCPSPRL